MTNLAGLQAAQTTRRGMAPRNTGRPPTTPACRPGSRSGLRRAGVALSAAAVLLGVLAGASRADAAVLDPAVFSEDFAAGFAGWTGDVTDLSLTTTQVAPPPGAFPQNFDASSGAAVLRTSAAFNTIFSVFLFRQIALPSLLPGQILTIGYDLTAELSDAGDAAFSQIGSFSLPPISVAGVDISALSGQTLDLVFGIEDLDGIDDRLTLDAITIRVVPLPAALPLAAAGVAALAVVAGRRRRRDG